MNLHAELLRFADRQFYSVRPITALFSSQALSHSRSPISHSYLGPIPFSSRAPCHSHLGPHAILISGPTPFLSWAPCHSHLRPHAILILGPMPFSSQAPCYSHLRPHAILHPLIVASQKYTSHDPHAALTNPINTLTVVPSPCHMHHVLTSHASYPNVTCIISKRHMHHILTSHASYPNVTCIIS